MWPNLQQSFQWVFPHFIVILESDIDVQQTHLIFSHFSEASLLNSSLVTALGVAKFTANVQWVWSHFVVKLESALDVQQTQLIFSHFSESSSLNKSSSLVAAVGVTKFTAIVPMSLVTLWRDTWVRLRCSTNPPYLLTLLWGRFIEQKLELTCSFRCGQIYNNHSNEFGHTLLWFLSQT